MPGRKSNKQREHLPDTDPDPDPDHAPHQSDTNLVPLVYGTWTEPLAVLWILIHWIRIWIRIQHFKWIRILIQSGTIPVPGHLCAWRRGPWDLFPSSSSFFRLDFLLLHSDVASTSTVLNIRTRIQQFRNILDWDPDPAPNKKDLLCFLYC